MSLEVKTVISVGQLKNGKKQTETANRNWKIKSGDNYWGREQV
jgi:hypothetical protein